MSEESDDLDKVFESVADGESVDWDALERDAPDEESRAILRQLRLIAEVAEVHRSQVDDVSTPGAEAERTAPIAPWTGTTWPPPLRVPYVATQPGSGEGSAWGHLLLVRKIGEGSYGEVYHAHDTWLDHPVALKLLKPEAESRVQPSDLLHEARRLARVRHDNVVRVHGADRHNGRVGFWMDFIDGETLAARVSRGRMSPGEATSVGLEVCRALAAVHRANIIHRDVKAQNVMRAHDGGGIILMDFGAGEFQGDALASRPQGTPLYMAPELFVGTAASARTDIYAVGVLLFHLVTDRFPVEGASLQMLRDAHARGERRRLRDERPELPKPFIDIVERAIDPDPVRRYLSAGEMEASLLGDLPAPPPPPPPIPIWDYARRVMAVGGAAIALTGSLGFIAARIFEVVLRIDPDFSLGLMDVFALGAQALLPFGIYWVLAGAGVGALTGLRFLIPGRATRITTALDSLNPAGVGTLLFVLGAGLLLALVWRQREVFSVLWALRQDPLLPASALAILEPSSRYLHATDGVVAAFLSFGLGLAVWRWFPRLEKKSNDHSTLRSMRWGTLAIAFLAVAVTVAPRRVIWESFARASFDNRPALVIGTTREELLLYAPDEADRPRFRVRKDAASLRLTGETRALFDRGRPSS